ncbi:MAG TPA: biotin--[acetyl-CoA-carboxylase] ligase [Candidatus Saccharimonadales bacterium]|nr:biotin--[acetyl-CoA-carboxylase] ligase [Candidatus Saccharimonadales bacterium]
MPKDPTVDTHILSALRGAPWGVSGAELSRKLNLTRAAIWNHIEEMRAIGYDIEASPHLGYRLLGVPDVLHADDLCSRLGPTRVIGREIQVFEETTSTNDLMARLARSGVKEGVVIFAESQTKGRGRLGRPWMSPARKGLWFSVLLRPDIQPQAATQLTVASATALARAITVQTGIVTEIKWPNDILIRGKKVAGILTEMSAELDHLKEVIIGIGLDVNLDANEFPAPLRKTATSLKIELGQTVDRSALAVAILRELDRDYERIQRGEFDIVAEQWQEQCSTIGSQVTIRIGQRVIKGRAEALDADGALLLRGQHGHLERIIGGDVTMEK